MKPEWWGRPWIWVALLLLAAAIVFVRRWVHHAQLESIPIIVPLQMPAADVISPPAGMVARRMLREAEEALAPRRRPRLAVLTFDDGPFPVTTPVLLLQLRALNVPAVFFFIGRDALEQPAIASRAAAWGMEIGNHTSTHPEMALLTPHDQAREIEQGAAQILAVTGQRPSFFRPPHGNYDAATIDAARAARQTMVLWDIDPGDWRSVPAAAIVSNVVAHAKTPAVILLHNGREATIEALPQIVQAFRHGGFQFVTLSELQRRLPLDAINDPLQVRL